MDDIMDESVNDMYCTLLGSGSGGEVKRHGNCFRVSVITCKDCISTTSILLMPRGLGCEKNQEFHDFTAIPESEIVCHCSNGDIYQMAGWGYYDAPSTNGGCDCYDHCWDDDYNYYYYEDWVYEQEDAELKEMDKKLKQYRVAKNDQNRPRWAA